MASLHRDRYMVIRDERDAYQQLQDQFSGQMDFTSKMIEEYSIEKDRLVQEISKGQKLLENLVNSFQTIFEIVSVLLLFIQFHYFSSSRSLMNLMYQLSTRLILMRWLHY